MTPTTTSSPSSPSSPRRLWTAVVEHARAHHASVNAAYTTYYGAGTVTSRGNSRGVPPSPPRPGVGKASSYLSSSSSSSSLYSVPAGKRAGEEGPVPAAAPRRYADRAWHAVKNHAREHHQSVEASHVALHGR